jgi:predicted amidohydrolase
MLVVAKGVIRVATCQFAVGSSVARNVAAVVRQIDRAKQMRADVVHFPESALTGYPGTDLDSWDGFDWDGLRSCTQAICKQAARRKIWVIVGSAHRLTGNRLPHNCLYLISPAGRVVNRYDKRFCMVNDHEHYTPGDHFVTFSLNGVRCALLICFDLRFPELYRQLAKQRVQCVFQSFYNARAPGPTAHRYIMRQTMQARAATNAFWFSGSNACGHYQSYPSVFIEPDGRIAASLKPHRAGVMVNRVDTRQTFYDPSGPYRAAAIRGALSNGPSVKDPRSRGRRSF